MAKKFYYDEEYVDSLILEYQNIVETELDAKGHKIVINKTPRVEILETEITKNVKLVVRAIIYMYRYDRYMEYDELESLGIMACFQNYLKFDLKYGSSFNFFSLIVKKCLYGVTTRNSKKREKNVYLEDLGDVVHSAKIPNIEEFVYDLRNALHDLIDQTFLGKRRKNYNFITDVICDYIMKTKAYISKTDMYKFCGNYSLRASDVRAYVNDVRKYYGEISTIIDDDVENKLNDQVTPATQTEE
jgi:hypothetical protein